MDLIIKPTERCNFSCTFCSSSTIADGQSTTYDLKLDKIFQFLSRFPDTKTIIVNGGDPLMMNPSYYWDLVSFLDDNSMNTVISFTTNLWDWWLHPEKWESLFKNPRIGVTTSFNYGETRRVNKNTNYTEDMFIAISNKFRKDIGYSPDFIAVITEENVSKAIDNVRLAKMLGVECKLNYAMASGEQSKPFPVGKMYEIYAQIYKEGLGPWEFNTKQMSVRLSGEETVCPQNRRCDEGIRTLQPIKNGKEYFSCGAFGDDGEYDINFKSEMTQLSIETPLQNDPNLDSLKPECYTCPAFEICNGCYKTIKDLKKSEMVEESCQAMKRAIKIIQSMDKVYPDESITIKKFRSCNNME